MANSERIDDIISDEAFKQLDLLLTKLGSAQDEFGRLAKSVAETNAEINKTQSIKDFNEAVKQANKGFEELEAQQAKVTKARKEANKAEKETIEIVKGKLVSTAEEKKLLDDLAGSVDGNVRANLRLKVQLKSVREELKRLETNATSNAISSGALANKRAELANRENELKQAITQSNLELRRATKEAQSADGSYDQLTNRLDRLRGTYKGLSEEERNNAEVGGVLLASIEKYDKQLKELDKSMGVNNRNVGNYSEAVQDAISKTGLFSREMALLKKAKDIYKAGSTGATIATQSFGKALIATGIGAIIVLLGSLITFLTSTQRGMDLLAKATDGVATFVGVFIDALSTLGEQLVDNIIPLLKGLGNIILGITTLDITRLKDGFDGVSESLSNINGISIAEVTKEAIKASAEAFRLRGELQELDKAQARLDVTRAQSVEKQEALRELSQDETKSMKERMEASAQLFELENALEEKSIALLEKRLAITKEQNNLTKSTEADLQKERDLEIEIANTRAQASARRRRFEKEAQALRNKAQAEFKAQAKEREDAENKLADAVFNLEKSRLKRATDRNKAVVDDEKLSYDDRLSNLEQYLENSEELIILQRDKELANADLLKEDRIRIEEEAQAELDALRVEGAKLSEKILLDQLTKEEQLRAQQNKETISRIKQAQAEQLTALDGQLNAGLITEAEYQAKRLEIVTEGTRAVIAEEIAQVEAIIEANRLKGVSVADEELKLAELRQRLSEETTKKTLENLDKIAEREKQVKELQRELEQELANLVVALVERRFLKQEEALAKQEAEVDAQREKEKEAIEASVLSEEEKQLRLINADKKAQIQKEEIEAKRRKIDLQRARFEKASAILGIKVDTARAIVAQLPALPFSLPLIKLIGAIGLTQLATAVATPIPAFEKGTKYSPEGLAWVGEAGTEMIKDPSGNVTFTGDSAELTYLKRGSQVIPHNEVIKMMENSGGTWDAMIAENRRGTAELKKALNKRPEKSLNITKDGVYYLYKNGSKRTKYVNKLL